MPDIDKIATDIATIMLTAECAMGDRGMQDYLNEKIYDAYYGMRVKTLIPKLTELHEKLESIGAISSDTSVWYGDMDAYIWIESSARHKIIVIDNVVSCADEATHIISFDDTDNHVDDNGQWQSAHVVAVDRHDGSEKKRGDQWKDHRDWAVATFKTYKDHDFNFGYGDGRDKNHVLGYDYIFTPRVENAMYSIPKIKFFMQELSWAYEALTQTEDYTRK